MKRYHRIIFRFALILICISLISGCYDRRELDSLGIVLGVALDKGEKEGETELTVQIANPAGGGASKSKDSKSDGSGAESAFINVTSTGKNINYIVREMQHKMSRKIYVAHSKVIVIGEELAKIGVRDPLDFFARAPEARMTLHVFMAKGKAADVLKITPQFEKVPSTKLSKTLLDQKITSHAPIVTEFEFVSLLIHKTTAAVLPIVSLTEEEGDQRLVVSGCAVFDETKMVGEFDEGQTRGLLFVKNQVKAGVLQLSVLDTPATIEIRRAKTKVTPVLYTDGSAVFNVDVKAVVGIGDQSGTENLADPDNMPAVLAAAEEAIKAEIQSAVDKSKELNADVFGFGEYLNRKYHDQWKSMSEKWDELYKNITVNITIKAKAGGSGRITQPLVPQAL